MEVCLHRMALRSLSDGWQLAVVACQAEMDKADSFWCDPLAFGLVLAERGKFATIRLDSDQRLSQSRSLRENVSKTLLTQRICERRS